MGVKILQFALVNGVKSYGKHIPDWIKLRQ